MNVHSVQCNHVLPISFNKELELIVDPAVVTMSLSLKVPKEIMRSKGLIARFTINRPEALMSSSINVNGVRMKTATTDPTGVCSNETILEFVQSENVISARYRGGPIVDGYLIGFVEGSRIRFRYVQADVNGNLDSGVSDGIFSRLPGKKLQLTEKFQWITRPESGTNIFVEV